MSSPDSCSRDCRMRCSNGWTWSWPAFGIPETQWLGGADWLRDAMRRWLRHIEDPEDIETYIYLRDHARRGFISHFPASRFISGQMKMYQILERARPRRRISDDAAEARSACWPCSARSFKSASCTSPTCSSKGARMSCASRKRAISRRPTMRRRRSSRSTTSAGASSTPARSPSGSSATRVAR